MNSNLHNAQKAWGENIPGWVSTLAMFCDQTSQKNVAKLIGKSTTLVNQVLSNKYPGDLVSVQLTVEGALMGHTVNCPELGEMRANVCLEHQSNDFKATNFIRIRLYKACRSGCPNSRIGGNNATRN